MIKFLLIGILVGPQSAELAAVQPFDSETACLAERDASAKKVKEKVATLYVFDCVKVQVPGKEV